MSTEYSGTTVNGFPDTVTIPSAGDPDKLASINDGLSDLADRTKWLKAERDYSADLAFMTWHDPIEKDRTGTDLDTVATRPGDSTNKSFFSRTHMVWVVLGSDTVGQVYVGMDNRFATLAVGGTQKLTFGCETADGRLLLFGTDDGDLEYMRSDQVDFSTYSTETLDGTIVSHGYKSDCVVFANGDICIVGGIDGTLKAWVSTDHGDTNSPVTVGTGAGTTARLRRVFMGKDERIVAFETAATADGGNKLYYSDDHGVSWTARTGLAFDNITEGIYIADLDQYVFTSGTAGNPTHLRVTDDVAAGSFADNDLGSSPPLKVRAMATDGTVLLYSLDMDTADLGMRLVATRDPADGAAARFVYRTEITQTPHYPWNLAHTTYGNLAPITFMPSQFALFGPKFMRFSAAR